jgi:hypothetical protein
MSKIPCVNCGQMVDTSAGACELCGAAVEDVGAAPTRGAAGLHPLAPVVFGVAAVGIGVGATLLSGLALGIPLGLLGGGIGVWMLERGRRLTN